MLSRRFTPRRYQLKKVAAAVVAKGHPWVFRDQMSTATEGFRPGQWLALHDPSNQIVGYGVYEAHGAVAIRVLKRGETPPDLRWLRQQIEKRLARRDNVRKITDAFRALHGENDSMPGIVLDVYGKHGVLQTYSDGVDSLGRWAAGTLRRRLGLESVVWKTPVRRAGTERSAPRALFGKPPATVAFREGDLTFTVDLLSGQKSGMFLDLRSLRRWVARQKLGGKKVLNLFSYTGTVSLAAERAGATLVVNVDASKPALDFGRRHHAGKAGTAKWLAEDVFEWIREAKGAFDLVVVDPPSMAARQAQVGGALTAYRKLYRSAAPLVAPGGKLVACCCTSRIARATFEKTVRAELDPLGFKRRESLGPEEDHPVGFPEGDYLKVLVFEADRRKR